MEEKVAAQKTNPHSRSWRNWLLAGVLVLLFLGLLGNLLPDEPGEVQVGVVRLKVPQGFEAREASGGRILLAPLESREDTFRENVNILREALPQPVSSLQYAQVVARRNAQGLEGFRMGPVRPLQILGVQGVEFAAQGSPEGRRLEFRVLAFVLGQEGYQITLTCEPGKLAQYATAFQEALSPLGLAYAPPALPPTPQTSAPPPPSYYGQGPGPLPPAPAPYSGFPGYEVTPYDSESSAGLSTPEAGDSSFWETWKAGEEFNTWAAEEWSQALSGETPDITHFDEQGTPYWEGPSGTLHEWDWGGWNE
jgi:hypothetical protein